LASVLVSILALVAVLMSVTLTPGMNAPDASFTVPEMLPTGEADNQPALSKHIAASTHTDILLLIRLNLDSRRNSAHLPAQSRLHEQTRNLG
jgi:hypothetical protein